MDSANSMSDNLIVIFLLLELVFVLTIALVLFIRKAKKNKKEDDDPIFTVLKVCFTVVLVIVLLKYIS